MSANKDHIPIIVSLRGIAASAVCFYHFICTTMDYVQNETVKDVFEYGQRGVQLFFVISGIVIPLYMINSNYEFGKWGKFMLRRFARIEPPYLIALLVGLAYLYLRNFIPGSADVDLMPSFTEFILHLGYLIPFFENMEWMNPVFWTLAIEFQYYIALSLLFPLIMMRKYVPRIIFYIAFIAPSFFIGKDFFPYWGMYFLTGIIYILYKKEFITAIEFWIVAILLSAGIIYHQDLVDLGIAVGALSLIHFLPKFNPKPLNFTGNVSYSLYLIHSFVGTAFVNFCSHRFTAPYQIIIVMIMGFMVSMIAAYFLYRFVEKPTHKLAKKIK